MSRFSVRRPSFALRVFCLVLLGLAGLTPRNAFGQTGQQNEDVRANARFHFGPFYLTPRVTIDGLGVDSNVLNEDQTPKKDFRAVLTPQLVVAVPFARRALITTTVGTGLTYYQEYKGERSLSGTVTTRGDLFLRRFTVFTQAGLGSVRDRPSQEIDARVRSTTRTLSGGVQVRLTPRFSVETSSFYSNVDFPDTEVFQGIRLQDTLNRSEHGWRFVLQRRLTSLTTVSLRTELQQMRFKLAPSRNADSLLIAPTIGLAPKALISGTAQVGYRRFRPLSEHLDDFSGVVAKLSTGYQFNPATRFEVAWDRDVAYSYDALQPYYIANRTGGKVRRQLFQRYDTIIGYDHYAYNYRSFLGEALPSAERKVQADVVTLDVGYRLTRDTRVGFGITRLSRPATRGLNGYHNYQIGMTLNYGN